MTSRHWEIANLIPEDDGTVTARLVRHRAKRRPDVIPVNMSTTEARRVMDRLQWAISEAEHKLMYLDPEEVPE